MRNIFKKGSKAVFIKLDCCRCGIEYVFRDDANDVFNPLVELPVGHDLYDEFNLCQECEGDCINLCKKFVTEKVVKL